ncbi:Ubiquitin carboxyl-terminal hydrolase family protein [Spironucleus salmonicida]|uniref:ubiquitinyl hydrolase 1 n=1 Tax=Spironucleus salmonicida TaxID=348837 RepID=V6LEQ7_9EUKA|nr:Ubiquitin carboxyl-terminal hydrolase family protein [Spironucleus salmonicida]|eukprot:EST43010.1 Ubiquitin carboxyl-terminal hydrolase family protein [Spironucleus salmonicida]
MGQDQSKQLNSSENQKQSDNIKLQWVTCENTPEVFQAYFSDLGFDTSVVDIYDESQNANVLIGIFNWDLRDKIVQDFQQTQVNTIQQTIENACADIAILHALFSQGKSNKLLGQILATRSIQSVGQIEQLHIKHAGAHEKIRIRKNALRDSSASADSPPRQSYHYIALALQDGRLVLYDGLQKHALSRPADTTLVQAGLEMVDVQWLGVEFI